MTTLDRLRAERVVAVLRRVEKVDSIVDALVAGGIRMVEITLDSDDALGRIQRLRARGDVTVLAGTVRTPEEAEAAAGAGAEACVAPCARAGDGRAVPARSAYPRFPVRSRRRRSRPPGGSAPSSSSSSRAVSWGPATFVRCFAPLADVQLIVTGGVGLFNAGAFIEAGAVAVGVGSALPGASDVESQGRKLRDQVLAANSSS